MKCMSYFVVIQGPNCREKRICKRFETDNFKLKHAWNKKQRTKAKHEKGLNMSRFSPKKCHVQNLTYDGKRKEEKKKT